MRNWKLKNGYTIFQVLILRSNCFLISCPNGNILVDTGIKGSRTRLMKNIKSLNLPNSKIDFLILTHSHFDHCRNARYLQENENCKIIMSENEAEYARTGYTTLPEGTIQLTKLVSVLGNIIGEKGFGFDVFNPDILVKENLSLSESGFDIEIIATPGHSIGSLSVIVNNEIAIVGDTMFGVFKNSIFPPFADNTRELIASWKKLFNTGCYLFLPGHGTAIKRELVKSELEVFIE